MQPLVPPPPPTDGGVPPDAGKRCSLFGLGCQTNADCCNGIQCTAGGGLTLCSGQSGCTCVDLIPR